MQVLYEEDIGVETICGGYTSCATCHVLIEPEWMSKLPERDQAELICFNMRNTMIPTAPPQLPAGPGPESMVCH